MKTIFLPLPFGRGPGCRVQGKVFFVSNRAVLTSLTEPAYTQKKKEKSIAN